MGRRETVVLDEISGPRFRAVIESDPRTVGLLQVVHGRRIVGIVVEDLEDSDRASAQEEPKSASGAGDTVTPSSAKKKRAAA